MMLVQVLCILLTQFSIGSLMFVSLLPLREIRVSFFTLNSLLCALTAAMALVLSRYLLGADWHEVRFLGLTVIGATAAFGCYRLDQPDVGRLLVVLSAFIGLIFGLLPLADKILAARHLQTEAIIFFDAGMVSGALLLGVTNVGMILGHWYLLMRKLSFEHLERFSLMLMGAVGCRIAVVFFTLVMLRSFDPQLAATFLPGLRSVNHNLFFFLMRVLWGLILPAVLAVLVYRCVKAKANQAATGLLYVTEVCVLFGELFAAYLLI